MSVSGAPFSMITATKGQDRVAAPSVGVASCLEVSGQGQTALGHRAALPECLGCRPARQSWN